MVDRGVKTNISSSNLIVSKSWSLPIPLSGESAIVVTIFFRESFSAISGLNISLEAFIEFCRTGLPGKNQINVGRYSPVLLTTSNVVRVYTTPSDSCFRNRYSQSKIMGNINEVNHED
ncbi:unnamed protein product [Trifolium pratense]|uniref:Uncharacterized protein n=1 Tax=Trifolium pratense TaxID=57577 RepID=A0ACB0MFT3_TRIPR|nr:unnamed protein product [Trifolium pratense]